MRLIAIIATILAISIAIPAGLLLTGPLTATQLGDPTKQLNVPESVVQGSRELLKELPPAAPESKPNMVVEPPKDAPIKPPEQGIILPPPKLPEAQPPQPAIVAQPPQQPVQVPQVQQRSVIEGIPPDYALRGALLSIWRAEGDHARDLVRAQLTDADLALFPQLKGLHRDANKTMSLKQAFQEIDVRMSNWQASCSPPNREIGNCPEGPVLYLQLTEAELVPLIGLVNSNTVRQHFEVGGVTERSYDSVVTHNGVRYLVRILTQWTPPS